MSFSLTEANEHYPTVFRRGMAGWGVIVAQCALNSYRPTPALTLDGVFGEKTEAAVRAVQTALHITVDGIAGQETQSHLCAAKAERTATTVPAGLVKGICFGESSGLWAATSERYGDGSRDYFAFQDHKHNPTVLALEQAANPELEAHKVAGIIAAAHKRYVEMHLSLTEQEAWECAIASYNWPVGADIVAKGEQATATYIESGTGVRRKFREPAPWVESYKVTWNGKPVRSGEDWVTFYVGSKSLYVKSWTV